MHGVCVCGGGGLRDTRGGIGVWGCQKAVQGGCRAAGGRGPQWQHGAGGAGGCGG